MAEIREIYKDESAPVEEVLEIEEDLEAEEEGSESYNVRTLDELSDAQKAALEKRMNRRRARIRGRKRRRKILSILILIAAFAALAAMCGRDIVKLNAENIALQKQQKELEEQRDRLKNEVEKSGNREYVQEQARKQLHLLNPGELLFTFEDEEQGDE